MHILGLFLDKTRSDQGMKHGNKDIERLKGIKPKKLTREQKILRRQELASSFPKKGNVRAEQLAAFWGIGVSTLHKYIADGRVKKPIKFGNRVAVWSAEYGHEIAKMGIPANAVNKELGRGE